VRPPKKGQLPLLKSFGRHKALHPAARSPFKLELIDLDANPDGELLRLIAQGTKAREAYGLLTKRGYWRGQARADRAELSAVFCAKTKLEWAIIGTQAKTPFGLSAKAALCSRA
jgi:hypothetical protein